MSNEQRGGFSRQDRDLILGPGEYANIMDETKGHVAVYVGPSKTSLSATDRPVQFEAKRRRFKECGLEDSIHTFAFAKKGSYIVLHNPTIEGKEHPGTGANNLLDLAYGNKINVEGPQSFALFPGQVQETISGHTMRSNQYLMVRVYDEEAAKENWSKATIKLQKPAVDDDDADEAKITEAPSEAEKAEAIGTPDLAIGQLLIIEGTKVSFYIPPTGIEVLKDEGTDKYVREAVTLERLEYCILLDEGGEKRYIQGPDVVFPKPTEKFVRKEKSRKFRAIELNELMGIYVKVIADYTEGDKEYKTGDELFITGKEQRIYYPRPEHAIIKYGEKLKIYALAIPEGEARYVLDRTSGEVKLKRGPAMYLPDPRSEVIVKRVVRDSDVKLWFPNNQEALAHNQRLNQEQLSADPAMDSRIDVRGDRFTKSMAFSADNAQYESLGVSASDTLKRGTSFTPPRTITIDSKYDGAVTIDVWPGYAVQIVSKTGERKVIVGPEVYLLEYDETLEKISFSSGTPKNDDKIKKDVYLRVKHNTISDMISVETKDLCPVDVVVSYRVNFEGKPEDWFVVENPVKFLTDHLRSVLRNKVKQIGIEEFYGNSIDIIRDTILGESIEGKRTGRLLDENGMNVYDLEVLDVEVRDDEISLLMESAQHENVRQRLEVEKAERELETTTATQNIEQKINAIEAETAKKKLQLQISKSEISMEASLADLKVMTSVDLEKTRTKNQIIEIQSEVERMKLELKKESDKHILEFANAQLEQSIRELGAETEAVAAKAAAISPQLMAVLSSFADKDLAGKLAENLNVMSILGGGKKSVVDMAKDLLGGTGVAEALSGLQFHNHINDPLKKIAEKLG
jgi:major vault protein